MNILFLRRCGEGTIAAPRHYDAFEKEVGRNAKCKWAGVGWPLHKENEPLKMTVERVMPNVDWVIDRERDTPLPKNRNYKVACYLSDLHGRGAFGVRGAEAYIDSVNQIGYDAIFMRYLELHGENTDPDIFIEKLKPPVFFLPWSVDTSEFAPNSEKPTDLTFIASVGRHYPLRRYLWEMLPFYAESRQINPLLFARPMGAPSFSQTDEYPIGFFGKRYAKALGKSKTFIFGTSKFRYPLLKFFEGMSAGCVVLADEPSQAKELGFKDGITYVKIDKKTWVYKLDDILERREKAEKIAHRGRLLIKRRHSHEDRAKEFLKVLEENR